MWYLVRRHLGFTIDEWEKLSWVAQRVYLNGIREEFYDEENGIDTDDSDDWGTLAGANVRQVTAE